MSKQNVLRVIGLILTILLLAVTVWIGLRSHYESEQYAAANRLKTAGKIAGLLAGVLVMTQFALSARIKWIDTAFGVGRLMKCHVWCGKCALLLAALHPILLRMTGFYGEAMFPWRSWSEILGMVVLVVLCVVVLTSVWRATLKLPFDRWKKIHRLTFAVAVLVFIHALARGTDFYKGWPRWFWIAAGAVYAGTFLWVKVGRPVLARRKA